MHEPTTVQTGTPPGPAPPTDSRPVGLAFAFASYFTWAFSVFYFKAVAHVPAPEILAHRVIWSALLLLCLLGWRGRLGELKALLRRRRTLLSLVGSALLVSTCWLTFIWAIANDRILQTSLGYFICPLVSVVLACVFLRERLSRLQMISVVLAAAGVTFMAVRVGAVPAVSLVLAFSFAFYGLIRKKTAADSILGLAAETTLLFPAALGYLVYLHLSDALSFLQIDRTTDLLLIAAGPVTALPLLWWVAGARRLTYVTAGLTQYLTPSITFLLAVFVFHEPLSRIQLLAFGFIWAALILYTADSFHLHRSTRLRGTDDAKEARHG